MSFQIQWEIEGEVNLSRKLKGLSAGIKNLKEPFTKSAEYLKKIYKNDVFSSRGAVIDEYWAPLSPRTLAQKALQGFSSDPLIRTGKMKNSFKSVVSSDQAVIYNDTEYFKFHQSNRPRKVIPRRVMMKIANGQKVEVVRFFQKYLLELKNKTYG